MNISRFHSNDVTAMVSQSGDGTYIASAAPNRKGVTANPVKTAIYNLDDARRIADRFAHESCDSKCGSWSTQK